MDAFQLFPPDPNPMDIEEDNSEEISGFNCVSCSETFQYMQEAQNHFFQFHSFSQNASNIQNPLGGEEKSQAQRIKDILLNEDEQQSEGKKLKAGA